MTSHPSIAPDALLFIAHSCPSCPAVLAALSDMVKAGELGELRVVNLERRPEAGRELAVRAVPWVRIGPFELTGLRGRQELARWAARAANMDGMADGFHALLREGDLEQVLRIVRRAPASLAAILPIVANPEASLNVRIGAGAVLESFAGQPALEALLDRLGELSADADARVRADACHYLGLTRAPGARAWLEARLGDEDAEVREIAAESLDQLASS